MKKHPIKIGMTPSHPGAFIKTDIIEELGLRVTEAANVLGVRRATLSDLLNEKAALSPKMSMRLEKAFNLNGHALTDAGVARCQRNATASPKDQSGVLCACTGSRQQMIFSTTSIESIYG